MSVSIKTFEELKRMRVAGRLAAEVLEMIEPYVKAGTTTDELNTICHNYITHIQKAIPAPLNYLGFPKSICTSINHVVCHGIPNNKKLKEGDIINIDVTVLKDGHHGDTSKMFAVGNVPNYGMRLIRIAQECLYIGISMIKPGVRLGDIGFAIQNHAEKNYYSVVREYCGHGIGSIFHEPDLQILHYGKPGTGKILKPGMTFTIEPMINAGKRYVKLLNDNWTVVTKDRCLSAQWEHTLAVTEDGYEIFTLRTEEEIDTIKKTAKD
ncbi:type I methionyl aminopeptidase [Coxiella endosymbiont of Amblyomma sculptum]|uniref:type I methionyl aminopeptidase n=1 Tax=Coxiella endosymbiont of Amblyomma sculptum TaxID=2487929 RepID=UPI00132EC5C8|nr:type I methionyl aminopeptidase [Coxiella endosymbiont of Amblyomma sculptum]QHG92332.1 type I methionyl aminopeptidase [Coxiella endosymbiont of Amblyomma sculptum]